MKLKKPGLHEMTDRERILMNVAALLAHELYMLQLLPAVKDYIADPHGGSRIRIEGGDANDMAKGDMVVCATSAGRQENPWIVSYVEQARENGCLLRSIGTDALINYGNESFLRIKGIPERLLHEGGRRILQEKVHKALRKLDTYIHRFRGIEFISDTEANVWFGECFGGLKGPTKPYAIKVAFDKKTSIKNIIEQLKSGGFGTREFEPDDGTPGPFHNPRPITRESIVGVLNASGISLKSEQPLA